VRTTRAHAAPGERLLALLASIACLGVLVVGASITPHPDGLGTHTQLGLASCGWYSAFGSPCPTCGMTTAVSLAAHGRLLESFRTQPMGMLIAVFAGVMVWVGLASAIAGWTLRPLMDRLLSQRLVWVIAGIAAASWIYKIASHVRN
jgi:Protein of unknown function (DUF2752)